VTTLLLAGCGLAAVAGLIFTGWASAAADVTAIVFFAWWGLKLRKAGYR